MEQIAIGAGAGCLGTFIVFMLFLIVKSGGIGHAFWGLNVAGKARKRPELRGKIQELLAGGSTEKPSEPAKRSKPTVVPPVKKTPVEALQLIRILQAESRLIDFLMEDLSQAPAEAVRDGVMKVQKDAIGCLQKHMTIVPVISGTEGERVTVAKGFDPSAIIVTGNVTGEPPFQGELYHPGWKVQNLKLPPLAEGQDPTILQPAEVQM